MFSTDQPSLKICGVTTSSDAVGLEELGVPMIGLNFWPKSKRFCDVERAREIREAVTEKILRVGVFVKNAPEFALNYYAENLIDVVQLHGEEDVGEVEFLLSQGIPVIRAVGADRLKGIDFPDAKGDFAMLIDTPAGTDYGGTGKTFDWSLARKFRENHPNVPMFLAGGITPENAAAALEEVGPVVLDVASGAELSPGIKDLEKAGKLLEIVNSFSSQ